jgi:hypothetical protein
LLATLAFVNPHRGSGWSYRRVAAADPRPHAVAERPLDLAEFHAATATTAFQVLVDGVLVHAWYADGLGPPDLFRDAQCRDLTYRTLPAIAASTATQGEVVQR